MAGYGGHVGGNAAVGGLPGRRQPELRPTRLRQPPLYQVAAAHPSDFNDITRGNNDYLHPKASRLHYPATSGYDLASGLGTLNAAKLLPALCLHPWSGWGPAEEAPGSATLNKGGDADITSVSCGSAGNCSAGGWYSDNSKNEQSFVVSETNGTWGDAQELPGTAALNNGPYAGIDSVSCASTGNCSAGGLYTDRSGTQQAFVVNETNGSWGKAEEVPGSASLNAGGQAFVNSVSCASGGDCSAGGFYTDRSGDEEVFVVNETNSN